MTIDRLIAILLTSLQELREDTVTAPEVRAICQRLLINHITALEALRKIAPAADAPAEPRNPAADPE